METSIKCPKCGSTQLTANKKGFSGGKALAGVVLTGGIGLLAGTIGSSDVVITCLNCGHQWKPQPVKEKKPSFTERMQALAAEAEAKRKLESPAVKKTRSIALKVLLGILIGVLAFMALVVVVLASTN